ncbi:MAG: hypothetical protein EXR71_05400 [Myxococcales bacterium]|nr:hypothetical protein [Myxococcales bacterium]
MLLVLWFGCGADCERRPLAAGDDTRWRVDGWEDREVLVHVPGSWDGSTAPPLVVARHGHSGTAANFDSSTCADGDEGGTRRWSRSVRVLAHPPNVVRTRVQRTFGGVTG